MENKNLYIRFMNKFNEKQKIQIEKGSLEGLNISWYAKPEFSWEQMLQIRIGLQKGLDVSWYAKPEYNWKQMKGFRNCLEKKIDKKDKIKLMLLTRALMENIDFTPYVLN